MNGPGEDRQGPERLRILHLEDDPLDGVLVRRELERAGIRSEWLRVDGRESFRRALATPWHAILADYALPDFDGLAALEMAAACCPGTPFVFVSGALGEETAVEALKRGATDYVLKDNLARLAPALRRAVDEAAQRARRIAVEAALRHSEDSLRATFEQAAVGIVHIGTDGRVLRCNRRFSEMVGWPEDALHAMHFTELAYPPDRDIGLDEFRRSMAGELRTFTIEKRYRARDGAILWVRITASSVRDADSGTARYNVCIIEDITEQKRAEHGLREARAKLGLAASIAQLGFWEWDPLTNEVYFSPEWKRQLGYADDELPDRWDEWEARLSPEDRDRVVNLQYRFFEEQCRGLDVGDLDLEFRLRHRDGTWRWIASRVTCVRDENGRGRRLMGTHLDVTSRKETEERIRRVSQHDALTGLPNRALLHEFAGHMLAGARRGGTRCAVLFLDLDRFKPINDTYGHEVGDGVLQEVARRLTECVRGDDLVGRLGGDEFVAVCAGIRSDEDAARAASHALERLGRPYEVGGLRLAVSPSIGISLFPGDGDTVEELIRHADIAMYHAKESGRNNFQFYREEFNARASQALRLERSVRQALDGHEFALFYQPVLDTRSGALVCSEALLRWPGMETNGPAEFIPIAETAGCMGALGEWVLEEACERQRAWRRDGLPAIPVAVNVSGTQFRQRDFADTVAGALVRSGLGAGDLRIEIAEATVMKNVAEAAGVLHALHGLGVTIALDDFGTGCSNLAALCRLPVDVLKLDRSFVAGLPHDPASAAVAGGILALGRSLGIEVIAEGIESAETLDFLRARDCRAGQGFHFCPPLPADEFERWRRERAF